MVAVFYSPHIRNPSCCYERKHFHLAMSKEEKIPRSKDFDEVDVCGADDDGGPDGVHAQPGVDPRVPEVDHQVVVPLHQPHSEARLKPIQFIMARSKFINIIPWN